MQLLLEDKDVEILRRSGGTLIHVSAFWKKADGSLFALAQGNIELECVEGVAEILLRSI